MSFEIRHGEVTRLAIYLETVHHHDIWEKDGQKVFLQVGEDGKVADGKVGIFLKDPPPTSDDDAIQVNLPTTAEEVDRLIEEKKKGKAMKKGMTFPECKAVIDACIFPGYTFHAEYEDGALYIYATYDEADTATGQLQEQRTRDWVLDMSKASPSGIVGTCFKCIITSMEHKTREWFTYQNKPIYQPHHDLEKLLAITEARTQ